MGFPRASWVRLVLLVLLPPAGALVLAGAALAAPAPCSITLSAGDTSLEAEVGSSSPDAVTLFANFTIDKPDVARGVVSFTASVDLGWPATASPSSMTVTNLRQGSLTVTFVAPPGARPDPPGVARVEATMVAGGVQCQGDSIEGITITPLPYLDSLSGTLTPPNVTVKSGAATITLALGAKANVPVTLSLTYSGPQGAAFVGPTTLPLGLNDEGVMNASVTATVRAPELPPGTYKISVRVQATTAEGPAQEGTLLAPLTVPEPPDLATSAMGYLPLAAAAAVGAGVFVWWRRR